MSLVRAVFLGTPEFAKYHLDRLLQDEHYAVVGVVTQPDRPSGRKLVLTPSPVKQLAMTHSIPVFTPDKASEPQFIEQIKKLNAEVAIVVAYGQILRTSFLELFPKRVVNVHGSLLPKWRGAAPIQRSLMNGDPESGVALQVMVEKLDAGPILGIRRIQLTSEMDAKELHDRMLPLGADLLHLELMDYLRGNLTPVPQDESKVTIAAKINPLEEKINWQKSASESHNLIRGLTLQGGGYSILDGKRLKIHKSEVVAGGDGRPGFISVEKASGDLIVGCGQGHLKLLIVQPEGKGRMEGREFARGLPSGSLQFSNNP